MFEGSMVLWLLLGFTAAFLAARKNRSFLGWLVIGLILPLIGLVLVLVLPEGTSLAETDTGSPAA